MKTNIFEKRTHFKPFEYPQLLEWIDLINNTFWVHNEVNFTADINDYLINLKPNEKAVFKKSLLGISQTEVGVKTFWGSIYNYLPKPEINGLGSTFAHNEWIHSQAYSNLLTVLGLEDEFLNIYEIPALMKRQKFNEEKLKGTDIVDKLFYFTVGIENASLFTQFGNILSLTRFKGLMKNVSNIISWTSSDEDCFHPDTELLTPTGWKNVMEFSIGDDIIGFTDGKSRIEKVVNITQKLYDDDLYKIYTNNNCQNVTKGHDLILKHDKKDWQKVEAFYFKPSSYTRFPITSNFINDSSKNNLTPLEQLYIAIQADGTKLTWKNNNNEILERGTKGGYNYTISISKENKIKRLNDILEKSNIEYKIDPINNTNKLLYSLKLDNEFNYKEFDWVNLFDKNSNWITDFINELKYWDGHIDKNTNEHFTYCSTNKKCAELVMGLCTLINLRSHISVTEDKRKESYKTYYRVYIQKDKDLVVSKHFKIDKNYYKGMVGCVTVPSGGVISKYDNKIAITGNCHANAGIALLNIIFNENPEIKEKYTQKYVDDLLHDYIKLEGEILDWIYEEGELGFFNKEDMINYMKNRLDNSMVKLGFKKVFNISNENLIPMKWFDEEIYGNSLTDFFASRPVDYTKHDKSFSVDDIFGDD